MISVSGIPATLFAYRRLGRELMECGVNLEESTRGIRVDAQTACLAASVLGLPADFVMEIFDGAPVKECEGLVNWALKMSGFQRVDALDGYAARRGRVVSAESRKAAYEAVVGRGDDPRGEAA